MAVFLFHVPLRGSVSLLFAVGGVFMVGTLAQGILISTLARQQLLASQMAMISTFLPAFLLSGFAFAIGNMPVAIQIITYIVPARYFVTMVKGIFLRGVGVAMLWPTCCFSSSSRLWSPAPRSDSPANISSDHDRRSPLFVSPATQGNL